MNNLQKISQSQQDHNQMAHSRDHPHPIPQSYTNNPSFPMPSLSSQYNSFHHQMMFQNNSQRPPLMQYQVPPPQQRQQSMGGQPHMQPMPYPPMPYQGYPGQQYNYYQNHQGGPQPVQGPYRERAQSLTPVIKEPKITKSPGSNKKKAEVEAQKKKIKNLQPSPKEDSDDDDDCMSEDQEKGHFDLDPEEKKIYQMITTSLGISHKKLAKHALAIACKSDGKKNTLEYFKKIHQQDGLKNKNFSVEEDQAIIDSINKFGKDWKMISKAIPQRNRTMLKNRYYYLNKKGIVNKLTNDWVYGKGIYEPPGNEKFELGKHKNSTTIESSIQQNNTSSEGSSGPQKKIKTELGSSDVNGSSKQEKDESKSGSSGSNGNNH